MIRHIVMWTLKDAADATRVKALLESCIGIVDGMQQFEVGIKSGTLDANVDVVLVSAFRDTKALDAYQNHPHQRAISAQIGSLRQTRHGLDYETQGPPT